MRERVGWGWEDWKSWPLQASGLVKETPVGKEKLGFEQLDRRVVSR